MKCRKVLKAILALPFMVLVVIPSILLLVTRSANPAWHASFPTNLLLFLASLGLFLIGVMLLTSTIRLFSRQGHGTLAPWDPTEYLVVTGPYRFVRNPMISGVLFVLLAEAVVLRSVPLLVWFGIFFILNIIYIHVVEEPGLVRRFGESYLVYRENVPGWIPRSTPWDAEENA